MSKIELSHVTKRWGGYYAVDDLSMVIEDNAFVTLLGPSGCGKTTTLRMIAGLETPTEGRITIDGVPVFDSELGINVPANKRRVGFLFQNYALWPNMTVYKNIAFGLSNINESGAHVNEKGEVCRDETGKEPPRKLTKAEIDRAVKRVSDIVKIGMFMDRYPSELSGGQQQRVAIARTLAPGPKVLFMDEPLSNLDAKLRLEMRSELQRLHLETGSTFVYVTHDQMEAMTLASRICLIDNGVLQQYEEPMLVYNRPTNLFVADFVGNPAVNLMEARGEEKDGAWQLSLLDTYHAAFTQVGDTMDQSPLHSGIHKVEKENKDILFKYAIHRISDEGVDKDYQPDDDDYVLGVRPEFLEISENGPIEGEVFSAMPTGMETTVRIRVGNYLLTAVVFGGVIYRLGQKVRLNFKGENVMLFSRKTGRMLCAGSLKIN
ncbi:MAG: ABC transporter ATP-binding protein [Clostridia bacterium]|nr:ABC transporter ATP-binding protein [Clostridia bacterium]